MPLVPLVFPGGWGGKGGGGGGGGLRLGPPLCYCNAGVVTGGGVGGGEEREIVSNSGRSTQLPCDLCRTGCIFWCSLCSLCFPCSRWEKGGVMISACGFRVYESDYL